MAPMNSKLATQAPPSPGPLEEADLRDPARLEAKLRAVFTSPGYRPPPLPVVALRIQAVARRSDATASEIVALLETDPMLAADVLRRASSATFGGRMPPRTLRDAAMRLGVRGLGNFVMEVALLGKVFRVPGLDGPMLLVQRHSTLVASCARAVGELAGVSDPDGVRMIGLLHDIGLVASMHALGAAARGRQVDVAALAPALFDAHGAAGVTVVGLWSLPGEIAQAIAHHHEVGRGGVVDEGAACVVLGDVLAAELGAGLEALPGLDPQPREAVEAALDHLGLEPSVLVRVRDVVGQALVG